LKYGIIAKYAKLAKVVPAGRDRKTPRLG
jgi:hypothetical protein